MNAKVAYFQSFPVEIRAPHWHVFNGWAGYITEQKRALKYLPKLQTHM